jgi:hypothetical protein
MAQFFSTAWRRIKVIGVLVGVLGVGLKIANLPIPAIRDPIAKHAPMLLWPSLIAWDHHYREGTVALEKAEQLIQQAKHPDDLDGGDRYLQLAQQHLDELPLEGVTNYDTSYYCNFRSCSWRFSGREIQQRRESAARAGATLTQERALQSQLQQTIDSIAQSQVTYQKATGDAQKQIALTQWEQDIQQLRTLSSNTFMGRLAKVEQTKAETAFKSTTGFSQDQRRSRQFIQAASQYAQIAQQMTMGDRHSAMEWQGILTQWESAIAQVNGVPVDNPDYLVARKALANYQQQQSRARVRLEDEKTAIALLPSIETQINSLVRSYSTMNRDQAKAELMAIEARLNKILPGTTVYPQAQEWLTSLRERLKS